MKRFVPFMRKDPTVAVLRLSGVIGASGRGALNDRTLAPVIDRAFKRGKPSAVALIINSPGGSPVQSSLIASRIRRLADEKSVPVHAFVEDVAASGGYWIAAAADHIWADAASITGSIGVISAGFGFPQFLDRHGIERRVYTAGSSKSQLDPFRAENPDDVARLQSLLEDMHQLFIAHVKSRRAGKLAADDDIFTGAFWLSHKAQELGLIDGIAHITPKMKELFGDKVTFRHYCPKRGIFPRIGMTLAQDAMVEIDTRAAFARFGL